MDFQQFGRESKKQPKPQDTTRTVTAACEDGNP